MYLIKIFISCIIIVFYIVPYKLVKYYKEKNIYLNFPNLGKETEVRVRAIIANYAKAKNDKLTFLWCVPSGKKIYIYLTLVLNVK